MHREVVKGDAVALGPGSPHRTVILSLREAKTKGSGGSRLRIRGGSRLQFTHKAVIPTGA